jgi:hypothetical protein
MSEIETRGSQAGDSSDWNHAWSVVSQLAAARGTSLRELDDDDRGAAIPGPPIDPRTGSGFAAGLAAPFPPIAPDQLAREIAEIERAAAALRRAEPTLERHTPGTPASVEAPASRSVWPLVCVIWLTAVMVVSCAIGTIVLLVGWSGTS